MKTNDKDPKEIRLLPKGCNPQPIRMGLKPGIERLIFLVGYLALLFLMGLLIFGEAVEKRSNQDNLLIDKPVDQTSPPLPDFKDSETIRRWDRLK